MCRLCQERSATLTACALRFYERPMDVETRHFGKLCLSTPCIGTIHFCFSSLLVDCINAAMQSVRQQDVDDLAGEDIGCDSLKHSGSCMASQVDMMFSQVALTHRLGLSSVVGLVVLLLLKN